MARKVRVAIIGAGSAGLSAVKEVSKQTDDFLLINSGPYGTTCARVACMPSKALIEIAGAYQRCAAFDALGLRGAERLQVDVAAALARVRSLRDAFVSGVVRSTQELGERNLQGHARFLEPTVLEVEGERIEAQRVIVATGSRPIIPEPWTPFRDALFTSEDIFEMQQLPASVGVIGLGAVGVELAQAMARLGSRVNAFDAAEQVGGLTDPWVSESLVSALSRDFAVHLGATPEPAWQGASIRVSVNGNTFTVERVLVAVGRRPNIDRLGLDRLGLELDEHGLPPFDPETLQVADLPVYLAGDVNGYRPLLHEAADEGRIAGYSAVHSGQECFVRRTPLRIAFSAPNAVVIGKSWAEVRNDAAVVAGKFDYERQSRARMAEETHGRIRVYADRASGRLVGAEIAAPAGEHLGHLLALAVQQEVTVWDLLRLPFYHPVLEEGLRKALLDLAEQVPEKASSAELLLCQACPDPALQ